MYFELHLQIETPALLHALSNQLVAASMLSPQFFEMLLVTFALLQTDLMSDGSGQVLEVYQNPFLHIHAPSPSLGRT